MTKKKKTVEDLKQDALDAIEEIQKLAGTVDDDAKLDALTAIADAASEAHSDLEDEISSDADDDDDDDDDFEEEYDDGDED